MTAEKEGGKLPPAHELIHVDPEVLAILGRTVEELAAMGLAEFAELSYRKGIVWKVSADGDGPRSLNVRIDRGQPAEGGR